MTGCFELDDNSEFDDEDWHNQGVVWTEIALYASACGFLLLHVVLDAKVICHVPQINELNNPLL